MKTKLTLSIDRDILQRTKEQGINISAYVESMLRYASQANHPGSNPGIRIRRRNDSRAIKESEILEYVSFREISGISKQWIKEQEGYIRNFLKSIDYKVNKESTIKYLLYLKENYNINSVHKMVLQIKKFLLFLKIDWANELHAPKEVYDTPKLVTKEDIERSLLYFEGNLQAKAIIHLGVTTGLRASELYALTKEQVLNSLVDRTLIIRSAKSKRLRTVFYTPRTREILQEYIEKNTKKCLFSQNLTGKLFRHAPIQVRDLRRYFSRTWDLNNGNWSIKERILGHSLQSVDMKHYSFIQNSELKIIYDRIFE